MMHGMCLILCVCKRVSAHLGVEALGILGDSVELWEAEHVLLAARPVKYPQSERRQCSKYLHHTHTHTQDTHTAIKTHDEKAVCVHIHIYSVQLDNQSSYLSTLRGIPQCLGEPQGICSMTYKYTQQSLKHM